MKIDLVAAARPNFMKIAPLWHALRKESDWCSVRLVHTGQHYDANMSDAFFRDLRLNDPDVHLGVGSGTHAEQTGGVIIAYEKECMRERPDSSKRIISSPMVIVWSTASISARGTMTSATRTSRKRRML